MRLLSFIPSFLILLSLIPNFGLPQGTWERIDVPTTKNLQSVYFTDSLYGWAVGDSGTILHTTDGGTSWEHQVSPVPNDIVYVFFLNRNLGWASAFNYTTPPYGSILLKTTNGGANWTSSIYPDEDIFITCIHYFDSLTGWMGGKPHALVKTTDGGSNWTQAAIDTSTLAFFPVLRISFLNQEVGFACGGIFDIAGVIWRTDNGGDLWYAIDPSYAPADEVHAIHIIDELNVIGSGGDPDFGYGVGLIHSTDGGFNWWYDEIGVQGIAYDLGFRTPSHVWSPLGTQRKFILSLDGGSSWSEMATPDSTAIFAITFPDSLHGTAVGYDGAVLKYKPPVYPGISPPDRLDDWDFCKLYPNPVVSGSRFKVQSSRKGFVTLKVYDFLGNELVTLLKRELPAGVQMVSYDGSDLPSGIYLYQLRIDGIIRATGKIVVPH